MNQQKSTLVMEGEKSGAAKKIFRVSMRDEMRYCILDPPWTVEIGAQGVVRKQKGKTEQDVVLGKTQLVFLW